MEDVYTIALAGLRLITAEQMYFSRRTSVVCMAVWRCCPIIRNRNLCLHRYVCAVLQLMLHQLQQCVEYVYVKAFFMHIRFVELSGGHRDTDAVA